MSQKALAEVVIRLLTEGAYRQLLLESFDEAIGGYDLTAMERALLRNLGPEDLEALVAELDVSVVEEAGRSGLHGGIVQLIERYTAEEAMAEDLEEADRFYGDDDLFFDASAPDGDPTTLPPED